MKLDATDLRYVTADEFRVLAAVSCQPQAAELYAKRLASRSNKARETT